MTVAAVKRCCDHQCVRDGLVRVVIDDFSCDRIRRSGDVCELLRVNVVLVCSNSVVVGLCINLLARLVVSIDFLCFDSIALNDQREKAVGSDAFEFEPPIGICGCGREGVDRSLWFDDLDQRVDGVLPLFGVVVYKFPGLFAWRATTKAVRSISRKPLNTNPGICDRLAIDVDDAAFDGIARWRKSDNRSRNAHERFCKPTFGRVSFLQLANQALVMFGDKAMTWCFDNKRAFVVPTRGSIFGQIQYWLAKAVFSILVRCGDKFRRRRIVIPRAVGDRVDLSASDWFSICTQDGTRDRIVVL